MGEQGLSARYRPSPVEVLTHPNTFKPMKSAYELAMERLEKEDPGGSVSLTDEQRKALADIDDKYKARIAEREVFLDKQLLEARRNRDREAIEQIETQLCNERIRLEEERESEKNRVRKAASGE